MKKLLIGTLVLLGIFGCTTQQKVEVVESNIQEIVEDTHVLKRKVAIARVSNETQYAKGIFYDKANDPIEKQASDILTTKLASTGKFILLERQDIDKIMEEMEISGSNAFQKVGADYLIIGSITEFGRKNVGDVNVFSHSKSQIVEAAISIRLVDVSTGQVIYSEEAKGQAETTSKTVMGLGERADFDAALSDKAISSAISKLVENIVNNCLERPWKSYFLSYTDKGILISGGSSQGLSSGDVFEVIKKGEKVENPQTGMMIELPGELVAKVKIGISNGDTPENEYSIVTISEGDVDREKLTDYYIREMK